MEIFEYLPHRDNFLFVDEIIEASYLNHCKGKKFITKDNIIIWGKSPENTTLLKGFILEIMAQIGGLLLKDDDSNKESNGYICKIKELNYYLDVTCEDEIIVEGFFINNVVNFIEVKTIAKVKEKVIADAVIVYAMTEKLK